MHEHTVKQLAHSHDPPDLSRHERRTRAVVGLTFGMMIVELIAGTMTHSLALLADGWHMASHAGALGLAALAYWFARTRAKKTAFSFGSGKIFALTGYTNAVVLLIIAILMAAEAVGRLMHPVDIQFGEALPVAVVGLLVNLASAKLLHSGGHAEDPREADHHVHGDHDHEEHHHDHNLRAAYLHVLADALTSVLAIVALVGGRYAGWRFLDALMAIVGSIVIVHWGVGLCRQSSRQLLDITPSTEEAAQIRAAIEGLGDERVIDLHLWEFAPGRRGCIVSLIAEQPRSLAEYRAAVLGTTDIEHLTIEVHRCNDGHDTHPEVSEKAA
jgi:cation diffusion facilitator family transporter